MISVTTVKINMALQGKNNFYEWVKDMDNPQTENVIRPDGSEEEITY